MKEKKLIKSPMNYIGGKYRLLNQILPLFPSNIDIFVDLFTGGGNVGVNVDAKMVYFNDNLSYLIDLYRKFKSLSLEDTLNHIEYRINEFSLTKNNSEGYAELRKLYNLKKDPLDLFVLIAYSFNHQIRFNSSHEFNNPFGRDRSSFNETMKNNLINFINAIKKIRCDFTSVCFSKFDFSKLTKNSFVYCDPPYLITTGTYNDGRRGFKGWGSKEEIKLLELLDFLNNRKIKFALSNVLEHKGKKNIILNDWINNHNYNIYYIKSNYNNSNYQIKKDNKDKTIEVLITNY